MNGTPWAVSDITLLRRLWADEAMSALEVADKLGRHRNAVAKKAKTIGLGSKFTRNGFWSEVRLDTLRVAYMDGSSFTEIAALLGDGCTRAMVASKVKRLGIERPKAHDLKNRRDAASATMTAVNKARYADHVPASKRSGPKRYQINGGNQVFEVPFQRPPRGDPFAEAFTLEGHPHARPWEERPPRHCGWPLDGPEGAVWSCCAPSPDAHYCTWHTELATGAYEPQAARAAA